MLCADGGRGEGLAEEVFGGAIVGGCVEGANTKVESAGDDAAGGKGVRIEVELGVEGRGAADQRGEDG